jgi:hypothetical protein
MKINMNLLIAMTLLAVSLLSLPRLVFLITGSMTSTLIAAVTDAVILSYMLSLVLRRRPA